MNRQSQIDALETLSRLLKLEYPDAADDGEWRRRILRSAQDAERDLPAARAAVLQSGYPAPDAWLVASRWRVMRGTQDAQLYRDVLCGIEAAILRLGNEPPTEPASEVAVLADEAMMNHRDLAAAVGQEPELLRKRLDRWRKGNANGWQEIQQPARGEPRYLYRVSAIRHLLR